MKTRLTRLLIACLVSVPVFGQESPAPSKDPKAVALLTGAMAAMGGASLGGMSDTEAAVQGTVLRGGERAPFSATFKTLGPRTLRIDANTPDGPTVLVVNGETARTRRGADDVKQASRMTVANGGISHIPVLSVLAEWVDPGAGLEYVGLEAVEGAPAHYIRLRRVRLEPDEPPEDLPPCELFLDARTLLLVRLVYPMHSQSDLRISELVTVTYGDYRTVNGLAIPHFITQSVRGQLVSEFRVTRFAVNQGISPSAFDLR